MQATSDRDRTILATQRNSDRNVFYSPTFSFAVLSSDLQMDTNFCIPSTTYLSLHQQSTNAEHSEQLVEFQTKTFDNRTYAAIYQASF